MLDHAEQREQRPDRAGHTPCERLVVHPGQRGQVEQHRTCADAREQDADRAGLGAAERGVTAHEQAHAPEQQRGSKAIVTSHAMSIDGAVSFWSRASVNARIGMRNKDGNGGKYM